MSELSYSYSEMLNDEGSNYQSSKMKMSGYQKPQSMTL